MWLHSWHLATGRRVVLLSSLLPWALSVVQLKWVEIDSRLDFCLYHDRGLGSHQVEVTLGVLGRCHLFCCHIVNGLSLENVSLSQLDLPDLDEGEEKTFLK